MFPTRYGFEARKGRCIAFDYKGCGGNANKFETMEECSYMCEDACKLPLDDGSSFTEYRGRNGQEEKINCNRYRLNNCNFNNLTSQINLYSYTQKSQSYRA